VLDPTLSAELGTGTRRAEMEGNRDRKEKEKGEEQNLLFEAFRSLLPLPALAVCAPAGKLAGDFLGVAFASARDFAILGRGLQRRVVEALISRKEPVGEAMPTIWNQGFSSARPPRSVPAAGLDESVLESSEATGCNDCASKRTIAQSFQPWATCNAHGVVCRCFC
jgi:hypothetical protein